MDLVDKEWLQARGDLHDVTVTDVSQAGNALEIAINDEWFNSRGLDLPEGDAAPGRLVVDDFTPLEGEPADAAGGWIYEMLLIDDQLSIRFCDRDPIRLRVGVIRWSNG